MIQPVELRQSFPIAFNGVATTTTDVWETLHAARNGDVARVKALVKAQPILACCKYNYAPPIHFAVREGHTELARFLLEHGGLLPAYGSDLFRDDLLTMARERSYADMVRLLEGVRQNSQIAAPCVAPNDDTLLAYPNDDERVRFRALLDEQMEGKRTLADVAAALDANPSLATDPFQFWGEGVLAMPCKDGTVELVDLLMRRGARVPDVTKWCARYYFKRVDMGALLLERGMNPGHMNWHHVTLLHEIAFKGDLRKAQLLLDYGADIDAVDEEYRSTPIGLAARGGQVEMVRYLLDRGADPSKAGADWATPAAWATTRGYPDVLAMVRM